MRIQSTEDLEREMRAVARGERPAGKDAAEPSIASAETLIRLLTPENRSLLRTIRDRRPQSVAELSRLTGRAEPNLLRTLNKLEDFGLVEMQTVARRKVPRPLVDTLHVEINPYAAADRIEARPAT